MSNNLWKMWSREAKQNDFGQSVKIWELFQHRLSFEDLNQKPQNMILVKWQFLFKTLSNENGLSYWPPLGLEWRIFCHSLLIIFHFWIGCCSLAAIMMVRYPYIYFLDSSFMQYLDNENLFWKVGLIAWRGIVPRTHRIFCHPGAGQVGQ